MPDKFNAKLKGHDWLYRTYTEKVAVVWACGNGVTELQDANLHKLGEAIAKHLDECEECE